MHVLKLLRGVFKLERRVQFLFKKTYHVEQFGFFYEWHSTDREVAATCQEMQQRAGKGEEEENC